MLFSFAFFAGVVALLAAPSLPPAWWLTCLGVAALAGWCARRRFVACLAVCGVCCGSLFAAHHANDYLEHRWPFADERVIATAIVDSIPSPGDFGWSFDATLEIDTPGDLARTLRARLVTRDASLPPSAGERWRWLIALKPPRGRANPGSSDLERQLFREEVHAIGSVIPSPLNRHIDSGHRPLAALRERISHHIQSRVTDRDAAALFAALAVGDTGPVSREQWRIFNATGTTHLVAISGLHVTLFAVVSFAIARRVWALRVRLTPSRAASFWPRETFAAVAGFLAAAMYATLAGLSVPTQRTLIMLGTWLWARGSARASRPFQPFALALLAVLLIDPFAPLSAGFWLSFAAMAAIIQVTSGELMRRSWWREAIAVQVAVTVVLIPFSFALFGSVSTIGPFINIVAIPVMSWMLVPLVLLSLVLLAFAEPASNAVLDLAAGLHDFGWPWLAAASDWPWALLHASPPTWWYGLALGSIALALLPWPLMMRAGALIGLVPLAASTASAPEPGALDITVLDTGREVSLVLRTHRHVLVYGTGDGYGTSGRRAEAILVPFLRREGVRAVDVLVVPPASPEAGDGVTALVAALPVAETLVGDIAGCEPAAWHWDGVAFDLAHACTLTVTAGGGRILAPDPAVPGSVLVAGASVQWTVVSGRRKRHPPGVSTLMTSEAGAVRFQMDPRGVLSTPTLQRADRRTLWNASP